MSYNRAKICELGLNIGSELRYAYFYEKLFLYYT